MVVGSGLEAKANVSDSLTEKLVFNRLTYDHQLEIAQLLLNWELAFLTSTGHNLEPGAVVPWSSSLGITQNALRSLRNPTCQPFGDRWSG